MCISHAVVPVPTGSYTPLASPAKFSEYCCEGLYGDIPFKTVYSKISYSLHIVQVWTSCPRIHELEAFLIITDRTLIYRYNRYNAVSSHYVAVFL